MNGNKRGGRGKPKQSPYRQDFLERFREEFSRWEKGPLRERLEPGEIKPQFQTYHGTKPSETQEEFYTGSGDFIVKRVYTPLEVEDLDPVEDIGLPGQYPYTRGRDPVGYRGFTWPHSFYSGYGASEDANQRYHNLLKAGSREIIIAMDLPTQLGLDSEHPLAEGEVGKVGVALDTLADLERIFDGIPLDRVHTGTVGNCIGPWAAAMFYALGQKQGVNPAQMRVWIQNDPIKEYTGRGTYIFSPRVAVDLASDLVAYAYHHLPAWHPQYNCTTTINWGGGTAAHEIGFGLANLMTYVEAARDKGVPPEDILPRMNLHMSSDNDLFEEVAKFRAARRLWARIARERLETEDPRVLALRLTVFTAGQRLTAQEPLNNVIRTTVHVLAAIMGGVDHIFVPAFDEALALPTFESTRVASLTKQILHDECLIGQTVDPMGGSYFVESLTCEMEEKALEWYSKVQEIGGAVAALEKGFYLEHMADGMFRIQREIEEGRRVVIGVNKHVLEKEVPIRIFHGDPKAEQRQKERLLKIKSERNSARVQQALSHLRKTAESKASGENDNILPPIIEAVNSYATVGEIFDVMRDVFGQYQPPIVI